MTFALPTPREEAWRWSDLAALPALAEAMPAGGAVDVGDLWIGHGPRLLLVDGRPVSAGDVALLGLGPVTAATTHPLGRLAAGQHGWTLDVPAAAVGAPIEIVHVATGGASHVPARIALGQGAAATIVETFVGDGWANRLTHIDLAPGAQLTRVLRLTQASGFTSLRDGADLATGACCITTIAALGGAGTRLDAMITLSGEGAWAEHGGALLARGEQRHDAAVAVRHAAPGGTSRQYWRAVADDRAACSLAARVEVARDAQKTDGGQSLKGLLLKRTATINLKPELEIFADDVKCAHGATVGELDAQALFYLASRGVPAGEARALLTQAFVASAVERIGDEAARDAVLADIARWLEQAA